MASRNRSTSSPWWGVGLLSLVVAGSSFVVPALLPARDPGGDEAGPVSAATASGTPGPTATTSSPTLSPTPSPVLTGPPTSTNQPTQPTPSPTPTTPSPTPTTPKPKPKPVFKALTINPWAKTHESSGIEVIDCPMCASGRRVQYLGQGHYVIVRLKDIPVGGRRTMTVIYTCACDDEPRELDISVNSDPVRTFPLKGAKSWDTPARFSLKITVPKGDSVIRFFNQEAPAPDLDQILIR